MIVHELIAFLTDLPNDMEVKIYLKGIGPVGVEEVDVWSSPYEKGVYLWAEGYHGSDE